MTYRTSVHSTTGVTPSSLFLKREMRTRFDLLRPDGDAHVRDKQSQQKADHDRHARTREFTVGDPVLARNYRPGPDWVPAKVIARHGPLSYLLETSDQQVWKRHVDQVTAVAPSPLQPFQPSSDTDDATWEPAGPALGAAETIPATEPAVITEHVEPSSAAQETTPASDTSQTGSRRYPARERHAPAFFRPET